MKVTLPVIIEPSNGKFIAVLPGTEVRGQGATVAEALATLKAQIEERVARGQLVSLEVESPGLSSLAGKYCDDPTLRDICSEAYELRQAELQG